MRINNFHYLGFAKDLEDEMLDVRKTSEIIQETTGSMRCIIMESDNDY